MFKTIVVAVDGSDPSKHALGVACGLATQFGAELHLVHSPQIETMLVAHGYMVSDIPVSPERVADAGKDVMEEAVKTAKDAGVTPASETIGRGDPTDDILEIAKLQDADLIVMGRRGLGSVASVFLGSVSLKVSHNATCSILTVH